MADTTPTKTTTPLPPGLLDYFAARQEQRDERVVAMWRGLTDREQMLVKEAAVMGWVRGTMHHDRPIPMTLAVVEDVLLAADAFADLYPHLSALPGLPEGSSRG